MAKRKPKYSSPEMQEQLKAQWQHELHLLFRRIKTWENKGYRIDVSINEPDIITPKDISAIHEKVRKGNIKSQSASQIDVQISAPSSDLISEIYEPPTTSKYTREDLYKLGVTDDAIDFYLSEGETLDEIAEEHISSPVSEFQEELGYYYDPETGTRYTEADPSVYERKHGRYVTDIHGNRKVKEGLEHHVVSPMNAEQYHEIQWENFIDPFRAMETGRNYHGKINPSAYFEELKNRTNMSELLAAIALISDESSNIGDTYWWYNSDDAQHIDKLQALLSKLTQMTDKDFSDISKELSDWSDENLSGSDISNYEDNIRQQNRGKWRKS